MSRPICPSCQSKPVGFNRDNGKNFETCFGCKCKAKGCFARAKNEPGYCDSHFKKEIVSQQFQKTCKICEKPSNNLYCSEHYAKVPWCQAIDCGKKVIMNQDGEFFHFCQYCKCSTRSCNEQRIQDYANCDACENNSVCQECGGPKSKNHQQPNCRKCQTPTCEAKDCTNKTAFYQNEDGVEEAYIWCRDHRCETKNCFQGKVNDWYCQYCTSKLPNFCKAENCSKPIEKGQDWCVVCHVAYQRHKVKCPVNGCKNYKFDKPHIKVCAFCAIAPVVQA